MQHRKRHTFIHVVVAETLTLITLARGCCLTIVQRLWHTVVLAVTSRFGCKLLCSCAKICANQVAVGSLYRHLVLKRSTIATLYITLTLLKVEIESNNQSCRYSLLAWLVDIQTPMAIKESLSFGCQRDNPLPLHATPVNSGTQLQLIAKPNFEMIWNAVTDVAACVVQASIALCCCCTC